MQPASKTVAGKEDQDVDPKKEAAYWRQQHSKQPYAGKSSYEQYEHAYRTGYNSFFKYRGRKFEDVEDEIALGYEKARPGSALPWDTVRPAVNATWERLASVISPRDPGRGVREWI